MDILHYGTKRHSGRYPWGSGDRPYQHSHNINAADSESTKPSQSDRDKQTNTTFNFKSWMQKQKYLLDRKLVKAGIKDDPMFRVGSQWLSQHDSEWQEVEVRRRRDTGEAIYANAAKVIQDFQNENLNNPYQKKYKGFKKFDVGCVNMDFGQDGTTQNCTKCTAALELRKRGYDIAAGRQTYPAGADAFTYWFKGAKREKFDVDKCDDILKGYGQNASGALVGRYPNNGGGHAMFWSRDSDTGQFMVSDGQNSSFFGSVKEAFDHYGFDKSQGAWTYRLDNCEPDFNHMAEDSVIRSPFGTNTKVRNKNSGRIVDRW